MGKPKQPYILEHGWTRRVVMPDRMTAKQVQEQIEYDAAVRAAAVAMNKHSNIPPGRQ